MENNLERGYIDSEESDSESDSEIDFFTTTTSTEEEDEDDDEEEDENTRIINEDEDTSSIKDQDSDVNDEYESDFVHNYPSEFLLDIESEDETEGEEDYERERRKNIPNSVKLFKFDLSDIESYSWKWTNLNTSKILEPFTCEPGVRKIPANHTNVFCIVDIFFDDDFFINLTRETNLYYSQNFKRDIEQSNNSNESTREPDVNEYEMKSFLGIVILGSITRFKKFDDFWMSPQNILNENFECIDFNRFKHIWRYLHFNNNEMIMDDDDDDSKRLSKIKPILKHFLPKFQEMYISEREVYLDEFIIPKENVFYKNCSLDNTNKTVILTSLNESRSGYMINVDIYTVDMNMTHTSEDNLLSILRPIYYKWHFLYRNNLNDIKDFDTLLDYKIRMCTVIQNYSDLPNIYIEMKHNLRCGKTLFGQYKDILLSIYKKDYFDTINILSTIHDPDTIKVVKSINNKLSRINTPVCVLDHLKYLPIKPKINKYLKNYSPIGKNTKWYRKIALFMINAALYNSFILYKKLNPTNIIKYHDYLFLIAKKWITSEH